MAEMWGCSQSPPLARNATSWGRHGSTRGVSRICKTVCWHDDFCRGRAERPPHRVLRAASARRVESEYGGGEPSPAARAGACELTGFLTGACVSGLWGAARARVRLEAPHLQQESCKGRECPCSPRRLLGGGVGGVCVRARNSMGVCVCGELWATGTF